MRIAIIGGGISGLAAAHRLLELGREQGASPNVHLFEAGERLGGVIATERRDGFVLEWGPDSFITDKPWALQLCRRLGLEGRLIGTNTAYRRSYVVHAGRLHPVPEGFQLLAPSRLGPFLTSGLFSWSGKLRMALEPFIPPRRDTSDESLADFVSRRLGREALARIAQPMVAGIYGADPYSLSLEATLPRFKKMEQEHGSLLRAMWAAAARRRGSEAGGPRFGGGADSGGGRAPGRERGSETAERREGVFLPGARSQEPGAGAKRPSTEHTKGTSGARYGLFVSFDEGMQVLVDALAGRLPAGWVRLGARVTGVQRQGGGWRLFVSGGEVLYDAVCLALPSHRSADLLAEVDAGLADLLRAVPYASAATVNLAYPRDAVPHPLDGFGFVVPSTEGREILGCTFSSVKFAGRAPEGFALLRAFLGGGPGAGDGAGCLVLGAWPGTGAASEPAGPSVRRLSPVRAPSTKHQAPSTIAWYQMNDEGVIAAVREDLRLLLGITARPLFATVHRHSAAMAQYPVGHRARVAAIEERVGTLPGIALAGNGYDGIGIPDCVHRGEQAAEALWETHDRSQ